MNWATIGIGVAAILFGVYTLIARCKAPEKLGKLQAMKQFWGENTGAAMHFVCYTLAPFAAGITFVWAGVRGFGLFD